LTAVTATATLLTALGATIVAAAAPASPRACAGWVVRPSPTAGQAVLAAVAARASDDVWAVGDYVAGGVSKTLIEHWDGARWRIVPSPNPAAGAHTANILSAVVALSAKNVWAFGLYEKATTSQRTLIEHWNGTRWSVVPSPNSGTGDNALYGAAARSSADIWAVGSRASLGHSRTLTEHWNGRRWRIVPSPNVGAGDNFLAGAAAAARGPVWAVGGDSVSGGRTLALRWTGRSWVRGTTANPGNSVRVLTSVTVPAARYALAVGNYVTGTQTRALAERWTGSGWSVVPAASPAAYANFLSDVAARGTQNAWAVGARRASPGSAIRTLTEHWNGSTWTVAASPSPGTAYNWLFGVAAVPGGGFWAVGTASAKPETSGHTLTEFRC
jgi:hypothetical protein